MAETHYFDIHIAKLYGVNCAIILQNLWHWIRKNEANGANYHDGRYWTYNSTKAFSALFPYLSQRQIETALKKLRDEGIVITGNYNAAKYDRTLWYAITEKGKSILHSCEMEITSSVNGNHADVKPIPNINANITPDVNTGKKKVSNSFDSIIAGYTSDPEITELLKEWLKVRKAKRAAMTDRAIQMNIAKLDKLAAESNMSVVQYLSEVICRGWAAFYAINNTYAKPQRHSGGNSSGNGNVFLDIAREENLF